MKFQRQKGQWLFTVCGLGLQRQFEHFSDGVSWVFTTKAAAACAADMEKN